MLNQILNESSVFFLIFSILRSVDLSTTTTDSKQFQELLLERTKALAAQSEALKSSNSDGKLFHHKCFYSLFISYSLLSTQNSKFMKIQKSFVFASLIIYSLTLCLCVCFFNYLKCSRCNFLFFHLIHSMFNRIANAPLNSKKYTILSCVNLTS